MICPRLHSGAGQTPLQLCPPPPLSSCRVSFCGPRALGWWLEVRVAPACQRPAHEGPSRGPFRDAVAEGEGGFVDLESAPTGPWGPAGLLLAPDLWALGLAGVRGPAEMPAEMPGCGEGVRCPPRWEIPHILLWVCEVMSKCGGCIS